MGILSPAGKRWTAPTQEERNMAAATNAMRANNERDHHIARQQHHFLREMERQEIRNEQNLARHRRTLSDVHRSPLLDSRTPRLRTTSHHSPHLGVSPTMGTPAMRPGYHSQHASPLLSTSHPAYTSPSLRHARNHSLGASPRLAPPIYHDDHHLSPPLANRSRRTSIHHVPVHTSPVVGHSHSPRVTPHMGPASHYNHLSQYELPRRHSIHHHMPTPQIYQMDLASRMPPEHMRQHYHPSAHSHQPLFPAHHATHHHAHPPPARTMTAFPPYRR